MKGSQTWRCQRTFVTRVRQEEIRELACRERALLLPPDVDEFAYHVIKLSKALLLLSWMLDKP